MKFILENYLMFVLIGAFLIFALIGYIIDLVRKNNQETSGNNIPNQVNDIKQTSYTADNIDNTNQQIKSVNITSINNNSTDDLLNSYNDTNNV